jgi:amino acid transporter
MKSVFTNREIDELKSKPFVDGVAPLIANEFRVHISAQGIFGTDLFLETLENEFIDTVPSSFRWTQGQMIVPLIISSDFLEAYNVFAPGNNLPQMSSETASRLPILIECSGQGKEITFQGRIVAFSDRINSVLVPKSFLDWANQTLGQVTEHGATRLFIKTKDANNPNFLSYLDQNNYLVNKDKTRLGRTKQTLQAVFSGLGIFGLLVVVMALMLFSFYLQLLIARSRDSLQLLLLLGYSPNWLSKNVSRQFIPVYIFIVLAALAITQLLQWAFHHTVMYDRPELTSTINWIVIVIAVGLILLSIVTNYRLVRKLLYKLY